MVWHEKVERVMSSIAIACMSVLCLHMLLRCFRSRKVS